MGQGLLYVVATPIGNLEDITLRALHILKEVDGIIAEDTRQTQKLLNHFTIQKPLFSFYEPKEAMQLPLILEKIREGKKLALVTDAGTPAISDPGFRLVRAVIAENILVIPIPGPCAAICALQASGLPTDHFFFAGYLPEKPGKRIKAIRELAKLEQTLILYLSPWKAIKQVQELGSLMGERKVCLAREMTKIYEEFWRGTLDDLSKKFAKGKPKGEMTLVIEGKK